MDDAVQRFRRHVGQELGDRMRKGVLKPATLRPPDPKLHNRLTTSVRPSCGRACKSLRLLILVWLSAEVLRAEIKPLKLVRLLGPARTVTSTAALTAGPHASRTAERSACLATTYHSRVVAKYLPNRRALVWTACAVLLRLEPGSGATGPWNSCAPGEGHKRTPAPPGPRGRPSLARPRLVDDHHTRRQQRTRPAAIADSRRRTWRPAAPPPGGRRRGARLTPRFQRVLMPEPAGRTRSMRCSRRAAARRRARAGAH